MIIDSSVIADLDTMEEGLVANRDNLDKRSLDKKLIGKTARDNLGVHATAMPTAGEA